MTLLYAFQGKNQAVFCSDLLVSFRKRGEKEFEKFIQHKIFINPSGDLVAHAGFLPREATNGLYLLTLSQLQTQPLNKLFDLSKREYFSRTIYLSTKDAQFYVGEHDRPLKKMTTGEINVATIRDYEIHTKNLSEPLDKFLKFHKKLDDKVLKIILGEVKDYFISHNCEWFAGFHGMVVKPGRIISQLESLIGLEGLSWFKD